MDLYGDLLRAHRRAPALGRSQGGDCQRYRKAAEPVLTPLIQSIQVGMKAFVINLKSRPDRWARMKKVFANSDIKISRINAVLAENPHYGVMKSFLRALRKAQALKLDNVLLLEDDCMPTAGWRSRWTKICSWLHENPDKWDLYSGGNWAIWFPHEVGHIDDIKFYDPAYSLASHWLYVPQRSYDKLIDYYSWVLNMSPILPTVAIDQHNNLFKMVISHPFMAYQKSNYSNTRHRYLNTERMFSLAEKSLRRTRRHSH